MADKQPFTTVVTPVYNGERYLSECIESVLAQTYSNFEYVILNNCSDDGTEEIARHYARQDGRIRLYRNDEVLPIMRNWNTALEKMAPSSRYCKVVHADDMLYTRCLEEMVAVAERHPSTSLIGAYSLWGDKVKCDGLAANEECFSGGEICARTLRGEIYPFLSPSSLLIRSDVIRGRTPFYREPHFHADVEMCYEVLGDSDFGFVHQVLTVVRRHEGSMTASLTGAANQVKLNNIELLNRFGPAYLAEDGYREMLEQRLDKIYSRVALNVFAPDQGEVLAFHRKEMERLGLPFDGWRLAAAFGGELVRKPVGTIRKVTNNLMHRTG